MHKKIFLFILMIFVSSVLMAATHTVRKGENLAIIAKKYGVTVNSIIKANNLKNPNKLNVGIRLNIPSKTANNSAKTTRYRVQKGDNLTKIASKYDTTVSALRKLNNLSVNSKLRVGQLLTVPGKAAVAAAKPSARGVTKAKSPANAASSSQKINEKAPHFWPADGTHTPLDGRLKGTMIATKKGSTVCSVSSGKVIYEGCYRGLGRVVFVEAADGYTFVYGGNEETAVSVGDKVVPGTEIGVPIADMDTGKTYVYFCVYRNGVPVDERTAPRT